MVYVKADVDEDIHKQLRIEAAERGDRIEHVVADVLATWSDGELE